MFTTLAAVFIFSQAGEIKRKSLEVGPGKPCARIEDAIAKAKAGDTISVYPAPDGYSKTAIRVQTPNLTIRGVDKNPVEIKGDGFE